MSTDSINGDDWLDSRIPLAVSQALHRFSVCFLVHRVCLCFSVRE